VTENDILVDEIYLDHFVEIRMIVDWKKVSSRMQLERWRWRIGWNGIAQLVKGARSCRVTRTIRSDLAEFSIDGVSDLRLIWYFIEV
jgi:hypothetical protein